MAKASNNNSRSSSSSKKPKEEDQLIERTVQVVAQDYLDDYYQKRRPKKLYSTIEERTKKIYGMRRADGFLAYPWWFGRVYTVSMEAKSFKTLEALTPVRVTKLWVLDAIWVGFLATLVSGSFFLLLRSDLSVFWQFIVPLFIFSATALIYGYLRRNSYKYQEAPVIHQVLAYPANERWISFSYDALEMIDHDLRSNFFKLCAARGIGVLLVTPKKQVHCVARPTRRYRLLKDFLIYYHAEDDIRQFLFDPKMKKPNTSAYENRQRGE